MTRRGSHGLRTDPPYRSQNARLPAPFLGAVQPRARVVCVPRTRPHHVRFFLRFAAMGRMAADTSVCRREYMREVTAIEPKWLTEVAPSFFKVADQNTISKRKKMEKVQPLFDKYVSRCFVAPYYKRCKVLTHLCMSFFPHLLFASPLSPPFSSAGMRSTKTHGVSPSSSVRLDHPRRSAKALLPVWRGCHSGYDGTAGLCQEGHRGEAIHFLCFSFAYCRTGRLSVAVWAALMQLLYTHSTLYCLTL